MWINYGGAALMERKSNLNQCLQIQILGENGSRTVPQTHEKRAHETVKGGPYAH